LALWASDMSLGTRKFLKILIGYALRTFSVCWAASTLLISHSIGINMKLYLLSMPHASVAMLSRSSQGKGFRISTCKPLAADLGHITPKALYHLKRGLQNEEGVIQVRRWGLQKLHKQGLMALGDPELATNLINSSKHLC